MSLFRPLASLVVRATDAPIWLTRHLSVWWKLAVPSVLTLALVFGLVWSVRGSMATQQALEERSAISIEAERSGRRALASVREMRIASREIQVQQTPESLKTALDRAQTQDGRAVRQLDAAAAAATTGPAEAEEVDRAVKALETYSQTIEQLSRLRGAILEERDERFLPLEPAFTMSLQMLRDLIRADDIPADRRDDVEAHVRAYQAAVLAARFAATAFLATGDNTLHARVEESLAAATAELPALLDQPISDASKDQARAMGQVGALLSESARDLFTDAKSLADFSHDTADAASASLESRLDAVVTCFETLASTASEEAQDNQLGARRRLLVITAGIVLVLVSSGVLTARAIGGPIAAMTRRVERMSKGDATSAIGFADRRDEIGHMAAALEVLRREVHRAFVQGQMIEQLPVGVMTAEPEGAFRITYINQEMRRVLELLAGSVPVTPASAVGTSMDVFHQNPAHQRAMIADASLLPTRARVRIGRETLELRVSALRDADGKYASAMVVWQVTTRQTQLTEQFERSVGGIAQMVGQSAGAVHGIATTMSAAADGSEQRLVMVAGASQVATGNVQAVAASAEELAGSVQEIARQVADSARMASHAVAEAEATDICVAGLADAAARIGDVVRLISDIAGRTNLLALNATIEAARAGDAGRGFAVVANEVKTLATQTAKATGEIGAQIAAIQSATGQTVGALRSIGGTIKRMSEIASAIAAAVEEQGAATQEIARSVQQAAAGTASVDSNIAEVTDAMHRTGEQSAEVVSATQRLTEQAEKLASEVGAFLTSLREAA